ncbi:hypothetical protein FRC08_012715 [Ceratobasidium sp. 394]|nr:hypothetical protein FRC08_012715 [Ceratobasidium sp. 394]
MSPKSKKVVEEAPENASPSAAETETKDVAEVVSDAPAKMAEPEGGEENYLEDTPRPSQNTSNKSGKAGAAKSTAKPEAAAATGEKRQRSIAEMFGGGKGKDGASKKARPASPDAPNEASSSKTPARRTVNGVMLLKYVPFSLSEFQASLTERQRELLALECDTLGKSWQVAHFYPYLVCLTPPLGSKFSKTNLKNLRSLS